MTRHLRMLFSVFLPGERVQIYLLLFNAAAMALIDTLGIASVMPFIAVVLDPAIIDSNPYLNAVYTALKFDSHTEFQVFLGLLSLFALIISNTFSAFGAWYLFKFSYLRAHSLCVRLLAKYLHEPYVKLLERSRAELQKIIVSDVDRVIIGTLMAGLGLFADLASAAFILLVLFLVDPMVTASTLLALGLSYSLVFITVRKRTAQLGEEFVGLSTQIVGRTQEALEGLKEIKVFRRENAFVRRLADPRYRCAWNAIRHDTLDLVPSHLIEVIAFGIITVVALYYLLSKGASSSVLAVIALYAFAAYRLVPTLKEIFEGVDRIRYNAPALEIICKDFDLNRYGSRGPLRVASSPLQAGIELRAVSFSYPEIRSRPAVQNLSMTISAGQLTCIMGPTGAGKSTTIDLILGLLQPDSGSILIDGVPIANTPDWLASVGYVPQSINLIDDTVAANIAYGLAGDDIDRQRMQDAARQAQLHEFVVNELKDGYETMIGERGLKLSGGQRQRLGLARALYSNAPVLILDEATNALDTQTERDLIDCLLALQPARTIVFVSHKASVARRARWIILLQEGGAVAQGAFDDLVSNPRFNVLLTDN